MQSDLSSKSVTNKADLFYPKHIVGDDSPIMLTELALGVSLAAGEDDRCFLTGGGSTESFFVLEDLPVGSVLGQLRFAGRKVLVWVSNHHQYSCRRC
jgi:hypothetical protein